MSPLTALFQVIFPATCIGCGEVLMAGEKQLCVDCLSSLNTTRVSRLSDNPTERKLLGRIDFNAAMSLYRFQHGNTVQAVVHSMKYKSNSDLCLMMGRQLGLELLHSGRFDDVDVLIPIPLHWLRRLHRGYNQSELLCRGIAEVMPRPIDTHSVVRHRYTRKQSLQKGAQRATNVENAFLIRHPEPLEGHHALLVDDVLTTGATLAACADALASVPQLKLSIATLSIAG